MAAEPTSSACEDFLTAVSAELTDEPLSPDERARARAHARECARCSALSGAMAFLGEERAEPDDARLARSAVAEFGRSRRRRMLALGGGLGAVAAAAVVVFAVGLRREAAPELALRVVAGSVGSASLLKEGEELVVGSNAAVIEAGAVARLGIAGGTRAVVRRARGRELTLELRAGSVALSVAPHRNGHVAVLTRHGVASVVGTVFRVIDRGDFMRVEVVEGKVRVEAAVGGAVQLVEAGTALTLPDGRLERLAEEGAAGIRRDLEAARPIVAGEPSPEPEEPAAPAPTARARRQRVGGRRVVAPAPAAELEEPPPTPQALLEQAAACRTARDWSCVADAYEDLVSAYPDTQEAIIVLVPLGEIELEHLERPKEALARFASYLAKRPTGALAPEGLMGKALALRRLGDAGGERGALEELVARFGTSPYAADASARLRDLAPR